MYIIKRFIVLFLLIAAPACASAELWVRDDFTFGAGGFKSNRLSVAFPVLDRVAMGIEAAIYNDDASNGSIYSARLPFYVTRDSFYFTVRPFAYPAVNKSDSWAMGLYSMLSFSLFQIPYEMSGQLDISVAGAVQHGDFAFSDGIETKNLPMLAYQVAYRHDFDNMFLFSVSGALFQYLSSVSDSFSPGLVMDNAEMVSWNFVSAYRKLPQLVGGIEISRTTDEVAHASVFFGYYYVKHMQDYLDTSSFAAGFKMDIFDNTMWFVTYNLQFTGKTKSDYYRIGLRMGFL